MGSTEGPNDPSVGIKIAIIVITTVLYAIGKWITAFIPTPWGVGELLVGIFLPAYMAVTSDTLSVAIGAGLGTFVGDFFVQTNPTLSLIAGVPANFLAFLFFGWFVKKYKSWPAFVAATVIFVSLGNLIAAILVFFFIGYTTGGAQTLPSSVIMGLTIFWNTTSIPAILIGVPVLVRATRPLYGRTRLLTNFPQWPSSIGTRGYSIALAFAVAYTALGAVVFLLQPSSVSVSPGLAYFVIGALLVVVFGSVSSILAGASRRSKSTTG
jgi:hypothetical protein